MSLIKRILIENYKNKTKNYKNNINKIENDNICYLPFNDVIYKEKKFILFSIK